MVSMQGPSSSQSTEITVYLIDYNEGPLLTFGVRTSVRNLADIAENRVFAASGD